MGEQVKNATRVAAAITVVGGTVVVGGEPASALTITVNDTGDVTAAGPEITLREAIASAAATGDTIDFDPALYGSTITLTQGAIKFNKELTIVGLGTYGTVITTTGGEMLYVYDGGSLTLSNARMFGGDNSAVRADGSGDVDLQSVRIDNNATGVSFSSLSGELTINRSRIDNNNGAGIFVGAAARATVGTYTAVYSNGDAGLSFGSATGSLTVDDSYFRNNGADGIFVSGATDVIVRDTYVGGSGLGGVYLQNSVGSVTLDRVRLYSNTNRAIRINETTGNVTITNSTLSNNATSSDSAINFTNIQGDVGIDSTNMFYNEFGARLGDVDGSVTITDVDISGGQNQGIFAASIDGDLTVTRSSVENTGSDGIYIQALGADVSLTDVQLSGNGGAGVAFGAVVGDVSVTDTDMLRNDGSGFAVTSVASDVTVTGGSAIRNGGDGLNLSSVAGAVSISSSELSANEGSGAYVEGVGEVDVAGSRVLFNDLDGIAARNIAGTASFTGVTAASNGNDGVRVAIAGDDVTVASVASSSNGGDGIELYQTTADVDVDGLMVLGNTEAGARLAMIGGDVTVGTSLASGNATGVRAAQVTGATAIDGLTAADNRYDGLFAYAVGDIAVDDSTVRGNGFGLAVTYSDSAAITSTAVTDSTYDGVALRHLGGDSTLQSVTIDSNESNGLDVRYAAATVTDSTISRSKFSGLATFEADVTVVNSTFSQNAVYDTYGGSIVINAGDQSTVDISHSTISSNGGAGTIAPLVDASYAEVTIDHSVLTDNTHPDATAISPGPANASVTVTRSLTPVGSNLGATNVETNAPLLGALTDNGGTTATMLPLAGSSAIDAGDPSHATIPATDQRGLARVAGAAIDIGAVEVEAEPEPEPETASALTSLSPERFADTRANGATLDDQFEADGKRTAGSEYTVKIAGRGNVPADAKGVVMNVTAIGAESNGFLTVSPCSNPRPEASSLNFTAGVNLGNELVAGLSATGEVCVFTSAPVNLTIDVVGFVPGDSSTTPITPARFLDTRPGKATFDNQNNLSAKTTAGGSTTLKVAGRGDVPADAAAVIVNVTAIGATGNGFVTVHPCAATAPDAASLNYVAGVNRGNELVASLSSDGEICLFTSSSIHLTADVVGYIPAGSNLSAVTPARLLDTRSNGDTIDDQAKGEGKRAAGSEYTLQVSGRGGVPAGATAAIVNVTAIGPEANGFVTVHPCVTPRPGTAALNYVPGVNGGNEIVASLNGDGEICLFTSASAHLAVDVVGYLA